MKKKIKESSDFFFFFTYHVLVTSSVLGTVLGRGDAVIRARTHL